MKCSVRYVVGRSSSKFFPKKKWESDNLSDFIHALQKFEGASIRILKEIYKFVNLKSAQNSRVKFGRMQTISTQ